METEPKISVKIRDNALSKIQVGFLCYDLQLFTEDCLYMVSQAISPIKLKPYPVMDHSPLHLIHFPYLQSRKKGWFFDVQKKGPHHIETV